jgi:NAD(P)-dependent dehydrogenase (short-subunit alcohol dehydrogenase family)
LASTAHRFASSNPIRDPIYAKKKYVPWGAYGDSKMANLLWAKGLALDFEKKGLTRITVVSVHPGVIKTALWNQSPVNRLFSLFVGDRDIPQGAASTVWAAVCPRVAEPDMRGAYISDCGPAKPNALALSDEARDEVWRITEEELARVGN